MRGIFRCVELQLFAERPVSNNRFGIWPIDDSFPNESPRQLDFNTKFVMGNIALLFVNHLLPLREQLNKKDFVLLARKILFPGALAFILHLGNLPWQPNRPPMFVLFHSRVLAGSDS